VPQDRPQSEWPTPGPKDGSHELEALGSYTPALGSCAPAHVKLNALGSNAPAHVKLCMEHT